MTAARASDQRRGGGICTHDLFVPNEGRVGSTPGGLLFSLVRGLGYGVSDGLEGA